MRGIQNGKHPEGRARSGHIGASGIQPYRILKELIQTADTGLGENERISDYA